MLWKSLPSVFLLNLFLSHFLLAWKQYFPQHPSGAKVLVIPSKQQRHFLPETRALEEEKTEWRILANSQQPSQEAAIKPEGRCWAERARKRLQNRPFSSLVVLQAKMGLNSDFLGK